MDTLEASPDVGLKLVERVAQIQKKALEKEKALEKAQTVTANADPVTSVATRAQLPAWPQDMRAMPNDYARCAIFTIRNKRVARENRLNFEVFHLQEGAEVMYTGQELRASDDELVWLQALEFAKHFPLDSPVEFSIYSLCKAVGWPTNGSYYQMALESLDRLQNGSVKFWSKRLRERVVVSFIRRFRIIDEGTRTARCQIYIEPEMFALFAGNHYTQFLWTKYRKLRPISRRLFDYIASHKQPYPLKLSTFNQLCSSACKRPNKWAEMTREACRELMEAGLVQSAWVDDGVIHCVR